MILDEIIRKTKDDLEKRKKDYPLEWLGRSLSFNPYVPRDVKSALASTKEEPIRIIAELKRASPSKGVIREDFDPIAIAQIYANSGANLISVLTEKHYFLGDIEYLTQVRRYVPTPLLRKDFIIDEYQLVEALVYGADMVLLIAKLLSQKRLRELLNYTRRLGMEALVEIHDKDDLKKAIFAGSDIIGINHRDLQTFTMDMTLCERLIPLIPNGKIIIAESGIADREMIINLNKIGVDAFLIGEYFMRQKDIGAEVSRLKNSLKSM